MVQSRPTNSPCYLCNHRGFYPTSVHQRLPIFRAVLGVLAVKFWRHVESMCVVKECRELEESFSTQHVDRVMRGNAAIARKETTYQLHYLTQKTQPFHQQPASHGWHLQSSNGSSVRVVLWPLQHPFYQLPLKGFQLVNQSLSQYPIFTPIHQNRHHTALKHRPG